MGTLQLNAKIEAFVAALKMQFPDDPTGQFAGPGNIERRKLRTLLRACGASRYSQAVLTILAEQLGRNGIYSDWNLLDPSLRNDDWVQFSPRPFQPDTLLFKREAELRSFVLNGIGLVKPFDDLKVLTQEHRLPSQNRIDILCEEIRPRGKGALVVLEFKRGNSPYGVVGQVIQYLEELTQTTLAHGRDVRAIILSGRQDCLIGEMLAANTRHRIESYCYSVEFNRVAGTARTNGH
jgi:hypothetical protein